MTDPRSSDIQMQCETFTSHSKARCQLVSVVCMTSVKKAMENKVRQKLLKEIFRSSKTNQLEALYKKAPVMSLLSP